MALSSRPQNIPNWFGGGLRTCIKRGISIAASLSIAFLVPVPGFAQEQGIGKLGAIIGKATVIRAGQNIPAKKGMAVYPSDVLKTEEKAVVKIQFEDGGSFMAFESSAIKIEEYDVKRQGDQVSLKSAFNIAKGKVRFFVKPGENRKNDATYKTKNAVMGIRGTSGFIDTTGGKTQLVVTTGKVEVSNPKIPGQAVLVPANFMTDVVGDSAPAVPKQAPAELLQGLNSSASSAESNSGGGSGTGANENNEQESENQDGADQKDDNAPGDDKEKKPGEQGDSKSSSDKNESAADSSGGDEPDDKAQKTSGSEGDSQKSEQGLANQNEEKASNASGQKGSTNPSQAQSDAKPAATDTKSSEQGPSQGAPKIRRVTVFSEDGSSTVSVSDKSVGNLSASVETNFAPVSSKGDDSSVQASPSGSPASTVQTQAISSATQQTVKQVQVVTEATKTIQDKIQRTVEQAVETTAATEAAKQANAPVSRSVKVKIVLPGQ